MPDSRYGLPLRTASQAKQGPYRTVLSPVEELEFAGWVKSNRIPYQDEAQADYDMRGYWKAMKSGDVRAKQAYDPLDRTHHFPDIWKTPFHQSFSNESMYALPTAPRWEGNRLIDSLGNVVVDESKPPASLRPYKSKAR